MVGVEHVGGVEPQLTFSKSESELLRMMRAVKEVTDHFHFETSKETLFLKSTGQELTNL